MAHLDRDATDEDLVHFIDQWAALMEKEDYVGAYRHTAHIPEMRWTPELLRDVVKLYDQCLPDQKVTVEGLPTDIRQRKEVTRWKEDRPRGVGYIWYDLNINGYASDLTATFTLTTDPEGLVVSLDDIHVM